MAMQALKGYLFFPTPWQLVRATGANQVVVDSASEKAACVFRVPKTGTITKVGFRTTTVTTGATVEVRLETVNPADGFPSGTLVGTNTNASLVIAAADDNKWFTVTLTAGASVTAGDLVAIVVVNPPTSFGNMAIATGYANAVQGASGVFPYPLLFTTSWFKQSTVPGVSWYLEYTDGASAPLGALPASDVVTESFNNASTPDERGNILRFPAPVRLVGVVVYVPLIASASADFVLYDADGTTVLKAVSAVVAQIFDNTGPHYALFASPQVLLANTDYRLVVKPTTASNFTIAVMKFDSTTIMDSLDGGSAVKYTSRADGGSWTETATQRVSIAALIDGLDDGAGPFHPLLTPQVVIA